jgi:hypothetical protein
MGKAYGIARMVTSSRDVMSISFGTKKPGGASRQVAKVLGPKAITVDS